MLSLAGAPFACRRTSSPSAADAHTQAPARPVVYAQRVAVAQRVADADAGASLALRDEPPLAPIPASPEGCTLERPLRSIFVGDGPISFATAAAGARAMLAIASATEARLFVLRSDQSTLEVSAPFAPASVLSASGADRTLALFWSASTPVARRARPSIALIDERDQLHAYALDVAYAPTASDITCHRVNAGTRCAFGVGAREEFEGDDEGRARFYAFDPERAGERLALESTPSVPRVVPLQALSAEPLRAIVSQGAARSRMDERGALLLGEADAIEYAWISPRERALIVRAPSAERCQPGGWSLSLTGPIERSLGATDTRPRGARIRATGAEGGSPIVFWLDEPQCNTHASVLRAFHGANAQRPTVLVTAQEYDAAADRALVSLAWRDAGRVLWARYRCPQ